MSQVRVRPVPDLEACEDRIRSEGPWTRACPLLSSPQPLICTGERERWGEREGERRPELHKKGAGTRESFAPAHQWGSGSETTPRTAVPRPGSLCLILRAMPLHAHECRFENPLRTGHHMGTGRAEAGWRSQASGEVSALGNAGQGDQVGGCAGAPREPPQEV